MLDAMSFGFSATNTPTQNKDALRAAISEAAGQTLYIPDGIYPTDPLTIATDHTHLQFAPGAILQVAPDARVPGILNIQADHVTIEGGQFDGSGVVGVGGIMAIRIYGSCNHIAIRNCTVRNASVGIGSYNGFDCEDWLIEGCTIDTTVKGHGIYLHAHPSYNDGIGNVRVINNTIRNTAANGIWIGNYFANVTVSGNRILNSGRMGIECWRNPGGHFIVAGNIVNECGWMGISICDTPHTNCSGNIITNATSYGIEVAASRSVSLVGNQIESVLPREGGAKPTGIALNANTNDVLGDITIQGGIISGCYSGINVSGDRGKRDTIAITGVIIRGCIYGIHNVGMIGARDGGGVVEHLTINGCEIHASSVGIGNSLYGGVMRGAVITGNDIHVGDGNGIDLFRPTNVTIVTNQLQGTDAPGSIGIRLRDNPTGNVAPHNLTVSGNAIIAFAKPIEVKRIYGSQIQGVEHDV